MNPENLGNGPDSSSNIFVKRKRGRPRKDRSQISGGVANVLAIRDQNGEHAHVTPGFGRTNGSRPHEGNAADHNDDAVVGQMVTGVIEATFGAGYLLSVRVGNSETSLRGVIFKPGHFMPISTENDVAPHIQMVRRSVVPSPAGYHTPVHGSYRRGRGRGRARSESRLAYSANGSTGDQLAAYSEKPLQVVPVQPSPLAGDRATIVPVLLQPPANPLNIVAPVVETPPAASQPSHLTASKSRPINQTETTQMEKAPETNNSSSTKQAHEIDGSTVKLSGGVMEEDVNEVTKRIQVSSQPIETENGSTTNSYGTYTTPEQTQDMNPPLPVKPLQSIWSNSLNQPPSVPQNFTDAKAGKMTELLLVVQENLIDRHAADAQHPDFSHQLQLMNKKT